MNLRLGKVIVISMISRAFSATSKWDIIKPGFNLSMLKNHSKKYPLTKNSDLPTIDIETFSRFFLYLFMKVNPSVRIALTAPVFGCGLKDNRFTFFSQGNKAKIDGFYRDAIAPESKFTSIHQFFKPLTEEQLQELSIPRTKIPTDLLDIRRAFAIDSFAGKCGHISILFLHLLTKYFDTLQFTYEGEPIIGWSPQDGKTKENFISPEIYFADISDFSSIPSVLDDWKSDFGINYDAPEITGQSFVLKDKNHTWLSFVLKDGRVFDLDLSAFQYGLLQPNPFITPVTLSEVENALNKTCTRVNSIPLYDPKRDLQFTDKFLTYLSENEGFVDLFNDIVLKRYAIQELFGDENDFWLFDLKK